ncbi:hypothetical protein JRQ81_012812 [Phrynocephalus forsythii]|uniref:XK-related protein n=1 Tax=Phrynocephalus forsythii TaxID=171643 RepID=A0A9Q0Y4G6_9SAUR|nr:hypothetical protein JRQ81_012812 [Phrynocephalus forsythii]
MADISMLRLFKTYLESTPQLILQIYIIMTSDNCTFSQYVSIMVSFSSISCATADYQISLRKSLPDKNIFSTMSSKLMYFSYKLLTLTSWILSIALVTVLNVKASLILLGVLWLGGISWVFKHHTSFCKSKAAEVAYRIIVGIILMFTFFNIKGENTKMAQFVYYATRVLMTIAIVAACMFWKSLFNGKIYQSFVIAAVVASLVLGLVSLSVYYKFFHPSNYYAKDVIDGQGGERNETCRIKRFLVQ